MADSDKALPLSVLSTIRDWVRSLIPTKTSDLTNDSGFAQKNIWYGTCGTAAGTAAKVVTTSSGDFKLATGSMVRVYFTNANTYNGTATLNVDGKGAKNISRVGSTTTTRYYWSAGEVVDFVYDGTRFVMSRSGTATTTYFGLTKLATSAYSTSTSTALTPQSLNGLAQYMLSGVEPYSASATYAVGDRVRYGYYIYECNTAITTAEAWTAAHWTALEPLLDMIEAKADAEDVPTKTSELTNDSGFLTAETDPTVPAWAKAASKPAYTAAEVGAQPTLVSGTNIKTVNGNSLLGSGDIQISASGTVDASLDPQSTNPVQNSAIYNGIETAKMDMLETATTVFTVIVSGTTAYLQAGITAVAYAYTTTQGCVFLQPLAAMSGWSDANVRIYQVADVDIPNGTIKLVSVEGSTIHIIDLTDDGNGAMAGTYTSVTIPSAITVDNSLDISSSNPVANSAIAAAINNIQSFCDLFNKKLTMSKSSWSSGTCTITNISKYSLVVIVASEPIVMVRTVGGTTWRGSLLTGSGTQYGKDFYFTASGDTCTYGNGVQLTHTASGNHSAATTAVAITACYGIVPLLS